MDNSIVTYSRSATVNLSKICNCLCSYCGYPDNKLDQSGYELTVPYSTIKLCSQVKKQGVKEILFVSGERPDNFAAVRARLDLWGFSSYIEYVYTVCELVFLEGFIPSIDIGYISPAEMSVIRRIAASVRVMIDTVDDKVINKYAEKRTLRSRLDMIKAAGEGKVPVTTGLLFGLGESMQSRKEGLELVKRLHEKYGNIQNVVLQNFIPAYAPDAFEIKHGLKKKEFLDVVSMAREILPADIVLTVPAVHHLDDVVSLVEAGVHDLGSFDVFEEKKLGQDHAAILKTIEKQLDKKNLGLQRRLPIFSKYIVENWYSRKLAQILDRYKSLLQGADVSEDAAEADEPIVEEKVIKPAVAKKEEKPKKAAPKKAAAAKAKKK